MVLNNAEVKVVTIATTQEQPTINFAIHELSSFLLRMSPDCRVDTLKEVLYTEEGTPTFG